MTETVATCIYQYKTDKCSLLRYRVLYYIVTVHWQGMHIDRITFDISLFVGLPYMNHTRQTIYQTVTAEQFLSRALNGYKVQIICSVRAI